MFGATLPASGIIPGVTTGHIGHHHLIHEFFNAFSTFLVPPGASGADIAAALADAHGAGGGEVKLGGGSYALTSSVGVAALEISLPTVSLDLGGSTLNYTGAGICLRVVMDPFTIDNAGTVRNGTIDGTGASAGAIGIQTGTVIRFGWEGVTVLNFTGAGSINWDVYNEEPDTWMERCRWERCDSRNGTVTWNFRAHASSPSMLYNDFSDCRFEVSGPDQTAIKTRASAQLYDCQFGFRGNVNQGATMFDLGSNTVVRPQMTFSVEQTVPSAGPVFDADLFAPGSDGLIYPTGSFGIYNFPGYSVDTEIANYQGRGETVRIHPVITNDIRQPYQGFGLTTSAGHLGAYVALYEGGVGANFAVWKVGFEEQLSEGRVVATVDSVTTAEVGFAPGAFASGARPAASNVPIGTMVYITDGGPGFVGIPVWSDGSVWRNAAGTVA